MTFLFFVLFFGRRWVAFDFCSGHSQNQGDYHYHFPPSCLLAQAGEKESEHSPQIGWSFDGFPIYGPRGVSGAMMEHCSETGGDTDCLDECSGIEEELPEVDNFK